MANEETDDTMVRISPAVKQRLKRLLADLDTPTERRRRREKRLPPISMKALADEAISNYCDEKEKQKETLTS